MNNTSVQRFIASTPNVRPARDKSVRSYGEGTAAGRTAAIAVFSSGPVPGGNWQHPILNRIADADDELRGWIVGYLYARQCLAVADGQRF